MSRWKNRLRGLPGGSVSAGVQWAWVYIISIGLIAILGPLIANEKPYYCQLEGQQYYPAFSSVNESVLSLAHPDHSPVRWRTTNFESIWRAPVPYSHHTIDLQTGALAGPFDRQALPLRFRHWLGTDQLGRDVLAGMIRGCRVSLLIGLGSMILALMAGVPLGAAGAYWGNTGWRISRAQGISILVMPILLLLIWLSPLGVLYKWLLTVSLAGIMIWWWLYPGKQTRLTLAVPLDRIVMSGVSLVDGFPAIFLILILVAIIPMKGWIVVMGTIALLRWPVMARYMRAEVFKIRETAYIQAAEGLNLSRAYILARHIVPFAFRPVMISFVFGVSSAILAESSLSFLGIGLPVEEINWGRLLAQSRNHFDAWWLVVFPGCAIFFTLLSLYTIGNAWQLEVKDEG